MRALVIDDSRAMRCILRQTLTALGFEVTEAANGQDALDQLAKMPQPPCLATVDWNMPVMNGLLFVTTARQNPKYAAMKLLMVTTEIEMEQVTLALSAGADEYVMKPFTRDILHEKLAVLGVAQAA